MPDGAMTTSGTSSPRACSTRSRPRVDPRHSGRVRLARSGGPGGRRAGPQQGRSPGRAGGRQGPGGPGVGGWARLWIGGGRRAGLRPGDIVGAITHEAGVTGGDVGAIQIADSFALVDVRQEVADRVLNALGAATIRGKVIPIRRDW